MGRNYFREKKIFFFNQLKDLVADSQEYRDLLWRLDDVLIILDRMAVLAEQERDNYRGARDFFDCLEKIIFHQQLNESYIQYLIVNMSIWYKFILSLVYPEQYEQLELNKKSNKKYDSLISLLYRLDLIGREEYESGSSWDKVKQTLLTVKDLGKEHHYLSNEEISVHEKVQMILLSILLPVDKYHRNLQKRLKSLICSTFESRRFDRAYKHFCNVWADCLTNFIGRDAFVRELTNCMTNETERRGKYVLLLGRDGDGKTALCCRLADELNKTVSPSQATDVNRPAPWLPGCLFHLGKHIHQPLEVVLSIVNQANALLVNPYIKTDELDRLHDVNDQLDFRELKKILYFTLQQLAMQLGSVTVIIDDIDQISHHRDHITFLPDFLPEGVTILLTANRKLHHSAFQWLTEYLNAMLLEIPPLTLEEVSNITGLSNQDETGRHWNEQILERSRGRVKLAVAMAKRMEQGTAETVLPHYDWMLREQADEWIFHPTGEKERTILKNILLLLAVFDSITKMDLSMIGSFLQSRGLDADLPSIRSLLEQRLGDKIEGLSGPGDSSVRLVEPSGEFVRNTYFSKYDLRSFLDEVVRWLSGLTEEQCNEESYIALISGFIYHWTDPEIVSDRKQRSAAEKLIDLLRQKERLELLYQIAGYYYSKKGTLVPVGARCLQIASSAKNPHPDALNWYGTCLLDGDYGIAQSDTGKDLIEKAARLGSLRAMNNLGIRLIRGGGMKRDPKAGEKWLRKAAESQYVKAMQNLGAYLLERKSPEGEEWVLKAIEAGSVRAMYTYGMALIQGKKPVKKDVKRGEQYLIQAAEAGDLHSMHELGRLYLKGEHLQRDLDKAMEWLQKAEENGSETALVELVKIYLKKGDLYNPEEARRLLLRSAQAGNKTAMCELGKRLLEGKDLEQNVEEGLKWLRLAAEMGHGDAMYQLGRRLLETADSPESVQEGRSWLEKAADKKVNAAIFRLAVEYLEGTHLEKNIPLGMNWLKKAAENQMDIAIHLLATEYIEGKYTGVKNPYEGRKLLVILADRGNLKAQVDLARRILDGDVKGSAKEAKQILVTAAKKSSKEAMYELGIRLMKGRGLTQNTKEGTKWMQQAAHAGHVQAMRELGKKAEESESK